MSSVLELNQREDISSRKVAENDVVDHGVVTQEHDDEFRDVGGDLLLRSGVDAIRSGALQTDDTFETYLYLFLCTGCIGWRNYPERP